MKMYLLLIISVIIIAASVDAQQFPREKTFGSGHRNKIEQLEKLKLIELLNLDEETSIRFFSRRNEHMENQRKFIDKREQIFGEIEEIVKLDEPQKSENVLKKKIKEVLKIENEMLEERTRFFSSIEDILTTGQIAIVITFEMKFREEIRNLLRKGPKGMMPPN